MAVKPKAGEAARVSDDPFVALYEEHTQLQVLAERFRQVADALDRGEALARRDLAEGAEVYRRFLVEVHQRREALLAEVIRPTADAATRAALDRCATEHAAADRFLSVVSSASAPSSPSETKRLAAAIRKEADRFVEHHRSEQEQLYHRLRAETPPATLQKLRRAFAPLTGEAGAAETRLSAWASHANPSAD